MKEGMATGMKKQDTNKRMNGSIKEPNRTC